MQVTVFDEDHTEGLTQDWPTVPRKGDRVTISGKFGDKNQLVDEVQWFMNDDRSFHSVAIHLVY